MEKALGRIGFGLSLRFSRAAAGRTWVVEATIPSEAALTRRTNTAPTAALNFYRIEMKSCGLSRPKGTIPNSTHLLEEHIP